MSAVEALDQSRRRMLLGALVSFTAWQAASIANGLLGPASIPRGMRILLVGVALVACAYWAFYLIQILRWSRQASAAAAMASALDDERIQLIRLKAFAFAFFAVMATQAILIVTTLLFATIPAASAAQITILVGCAAAIGGFLTYERE